MLKPNSTVTNNLIKARELIADPKNWCVGEIENERGQRCAHGALNAAAPHANLLVEGNLLADASRDLYGVRHTPYINNHLGHAAVMRVFDRAIELSLQDG